MDDIEAVCIYCSHLCGCRLLVDKQHAFHSEAIVTFENPGACPAWEPVIASVKNTRARAYDRVGNGCLRGMATLHQTVELELKRQEEAKALMEAPDLASIIRQGMSSEEREQQLRFMTEDDGSLTLAEDGQPIPRPTQEVRSFAASENFHVQMPKDQALYATFNQVLKHIVGVEIENGWLVKSKRAKKGAEENDQTMATIIKPSAGKTVNIRVPAKPAALTVKAPAVKAQSKPAATAVVKQSAPVAKRPVALPPGQVKNMLARTPSAQPAVTAIRPKKSPLAVPIKAQRKPVQEPEEEQVQEEQVEEQVEEQAVEAQAPVVDTDSIAQAVVEAITPAITEVVQGMIESAVEQVNTMLCVFHDHEHLLVQQVCEQANAAFKSLKGKSDFNIDAFEQKTGVQGGLLSYISDAAVDADGEPQEEEVAADEGEVEGE